MAGWLDGYLIWYRSLVGICLRYEEGHSPRVGRSCTPGHELTVSVKGWMIQICRIKVCVYIRVEAMEANGYITKLSSMS